VRNGRDGEADNIIHGNCATACRLFKCISVFIFVKLVLFCDKLLLNRGI